MSICNAINCLNAKIASLPDKMCLRGELAFDRWYFHYQPASATKELGQVSSRLWAVAYALESLVKAAIVAISILICGLMENEPEVEKRCEVLKAQGNSLLYIAYALLLVQKQRERLSKKTILLNQD